MPLGRALARDSGNVIKKAHVEHAVGFIQHQCIECLHGQVATRQVVHHSPWRAHHNVRAVFQRRTLPAQRNATAQCDHLDVVHGARQPADFDRDLVGQFTRGAQHQRLHGKAPRVKPLQQRQSKRCGFAAAGFCLGNQIFAGQCWRQTHGLDRGHRQVTQLRQIVQGGRVERQGAEGWGGSVCHALIIGSAIASALLIRSHPELVAHRARIARWESAGTSLALVVVTIAWQV